MKQALCRRKGEGVGHFDRFGQPEVTHSAWAGLHKWPRPLGGDLPPGAEQFGFPPAAGSFSRCHWRRHKRTADAVEAWATPKRNQTSTPRLFSQRCRVDFLVGVFIVAQRLAGAEDMSDQDDWDKQMERLDERTAKRRAKSQELEEEMRKAIREADERRDAEERRDAKESPDESEGPEE